MGEGLKSSNVWYGHAHALTWVQPELPPGFDGTSYADSGWCFVEASLSSVLKSSTRRVDIGKFTAVELFFPNVRYAIELCVVGGFVWRLVFVYNEYKLGKGVATNDTAASQSALHTLAMMRGIGLVVFGVLQLALAAIDYFREPAEQRRWTQNDTVETGVGVLFVGAGVALCYNDQFALVDLR